MTGRPASTEGTVTMPQDWRALFGDVSGNVEFRRKFHRPTNLDSHERVFVVFTEIRGTGTVELNQTAVGQFSLTDPTVEIDVTNLLASFNLLSVQLEFDPGREPNVEGGLYGPVALDIRSHPV